MLSKNTSEFVGLTSLIDDKQLMVVSNLKNILVYSEIEDQKLTLEQNNTGKDYL